MNTITPIINMQVMKRKRGYECEPPEFKPVVSETHYEQAVDCPRCGRRTRTLFSLGEMWRGYLCDNCLSKLAVTLMRAVTHR